jgi:Fe-S-cluster containining protein
MISVDFDCQSCGACCAYNASWPRFSTETDEELDELPRHLVAEDEQGMRCYGDRCAALSGSVGVSTSCTVYDIRPDICRACMPGDGACLEARAAYGFSL